MKKPNNMKLKTLFISLLLLLVASASAAISSGYYRVISYNGKYLTENTSNHTLVCSDLASSNYAQVWYLNVSGTSVTFTNALTDYGIFSFWDVSTQDPNYTSPTNFYPTETNSVFVFADSEGGSVGLHCDNSNNVVRWDTSDNKSKWTIVEVEVDASALAAQKSAIAEATTGQLTTYFTTTACTALNNTYTGYTDEDLRSAMSALPTSVQNLAVKVKNNSWTTYTGWSKTEKSFRIGSYKAYSKHDRWNNIIGTGYVFGRLTNPTGISVTAGDYIQVYVGAIPSGQAVKLEVAGLYQPSGTTYALHEGMNVLLMASSGNCFVNYEVDNTTSGNAPYTAINSYDPVTVHIEGGTVNGYFDLTKSYTNDDWAALQTHLLTGSTVELKTNNLVFHLTTDLVKTACPTQMVELLGEWDKILNMEHSLMGLESFNGYWNNLLSVTDMADGYMHATNYGTYYHTNTISSVMSYANMFAGGALWGPAHENGHVFQKYINMVGQTEVSNNLFSNVAIYNNGHLTSRAANISTTFENMRDNVFWNDRGIWERTHLYFQLYQFFHILGKDADFYPELFKAFRSDPMVHTGNIFISATDDYLKFYKKCCSVSGYDLTEFFQAYGFFVIPTLTSYTLDAGTQNAYKVEDYANYYLTITQSEIDAAKQAVAAMNLPKANIIFIEDRITAPDATFEGATAGTKKTEFSNEYPIGQSGETGQYTTFGADCSAYTYSVSGTTVTMAGTGAVGFKVYDSTGNLRGLYNTYSFTLPDGIGSGYTIKAAGGNGTDVEATDNAAIVVESDVTDVISVGAKITAEDQLVSGKVYLLRNTASGNPWITDAGTYYSVPNGGGTLDGSCIYYLIQDGDKWKIKNYATGKYWGEPTAASTTNPGGFVPVDEANAGSWSLNFNSSGNIDPQCNGFYINRSSQKMHGWGSSLSSQIYEVGLTYPPFSEFADKDIRVSSDAAASLQTGKWYVMFDRGANHGYLYENNANKLYNTATIPSGSATDNAKYLVRIVGWDNEYYLQTGLGNFFGNIQQSTNVPTTSTATNQITVKKINSTDGHFYLQSAAGVVLDANDLSLGDGTVVGWGTTAPTSTGGNNDWAFYPVEFVDSWMPTVSEVYTITNTNIGATRGSLIYYPTGSTKWVWASGKSGSFNASEANSQWVFIPTGTSGQYYLYNVGAGKFAIPMKGGTYGGGNSYSWGFSDDAVALYLTKQDDGSYKIFSVNHNVVMSISTGYTGPVINYNDNGAKFNISLVDGQNQSVAATAAFDKLIENTTALTAVPSTDGWYAIKIQSHTSQTTYAGNFLYSLATEYQSNGYNYPLGHASEVKIRPAINDATYFIKIIKDGNYYHIQLPTGKYALNQSNNFPTSKITRGGSMAIEYQAAGYFDIKSSGYYFDAQSDHIDKTNTLGQTKLDIYPIDLATAGLTAWRVSIDATYGETLTCTTAGIKGLSTVYNNGYFFLPTGTTPVSTDFTIGNPTEVEGMGVILDSENKIITVATADQVNFTTDNIVIAQGNQTTGKGNAMQTLLRMKVTPTIFGTPTSINVTLTGAEQLDNVAVYTTTDSDLHAATASPVKVSNDIAASANVTIPLTMSAIPSGQALYIWITGDVKSGASELGTIDATITSMTYNNAFGESQTLDLASIGNPDGNMRIFKTQSYPWTASHANTKYYRIPTIINTADGGIVALTDDRYSSTSDLGNHKIDVVARKSMDGGLTWGDPVTVAAGDGSSDAAYGYGDPAVVRTLNGKLICLMAAGKNSFSGGMLHMGYSESMDNGATWSAVTDIYSSINKNGAEITSAFTTAGKGVTFSNGRVAFAMNGKVSGTNNEFVLYSDNEGATWSLSPSIYSGADESKLEIMNDNSLLVSVRRGGWNTMANRGYNRTTGDASGDGINSWGTQGVWGDEMNANGCNADILYYKQDGCDVLLHTLTKNYSTYRKDLRLYMSFDEGITWQEVYQLQPGYAAYSSMQKLANGDLAIIFEDGSIGNQDKMDCYAINYIVISKETIEAWYDAADYRPDTNLENSFVIKNYNTGAGDRYIKSAKFNTASDLNVYRTSTESEAAEIIILKDYDNTGFYYVYDLKSNFYLKGATDDSNGTAWTYSTTPVTVKLIDNTANHLGWARTDGHIYLIENSGEAMANAYSGPNGTQVKNYTDANDAGSHWYLIKTGNSTTSNVYTDPNALYRIKNANVNNYFEAGADGNLTRNTSATAGTYAIIPVSNSAGQFYIYDTQQRNYVVPEESNGNGGQWTRSSAIPTAVTITNNLTNENLASWKPSGIPYTLGSKMANAYKGGSSGDVRNYNNASDKGSRWYLERVDNSTNAVVDITAVKSNIESLVNSAAAAGTQLQYTATVGTAARGTLVIPFNADVPGETVEAYTLESVDGSDHIHGTKVTTIEANKPVLLKNSGTIVLTAKSGTLEYTVSPTYGLLNGVYERTEVPAGSYVLQNLPAKSGVAFYLVEEGHRPFVNAFRAYLSESSSARVLTFSFEEETTGINSIDNGQLIMDNGAVYDLQGRKVANPSRGLYIVNGHKVVIK